MANHWIDQPSYSVGPITWKTGPTQNKLHVFADFLIYFLRFFFCYWFLLFILMISVFVFLLSFLLGDRDREEAKANLGRIKEGDTVTNLYYTKNIFKYKRGISKK